MQRLLASRTDTVRSWCTLDPPEQQGTRPLPGALAMGGGPISPGTAAEARQRLRFP